MREFEEIDISRQSCRGDLTARRKTLQTLVSISSENLTSVHLDLVRFFQNVSDLLSEFDQISKKLFRKHNTMPKKASFPTSKIKMICGASTQKKKNASITNGIFWSWMKQFLPWYTITNTHYETNFFYQTLLSWFP